jgi:hypothetical protein
MSDFKTPQEKKRLSLTRDRRNTYGENDKASRKAIPRRKQSGQMQLRRGIKQELVGATGVVTEADIDDTAEQVVGVQAAKKRRLFKKSPDEPLGVVIEKQRQLRASTKSAAVSKRAGSQR